MYIIHIYYIYYIIFTKYTLVKHTYMCIHIKVSIYGEWLFQ